MTTIKLGDVGIQVRKIQLLLNSLLTPKPHLKPDGYFGPVTRAAVEAFQLMMKLPQDGVVRRETLVAAGLKEVLAPTLPIVSPNAPWMDIAVAELGVHEDSLPGRHCARIIEYHQTTTLKATDDETPWCSSFVNWVMQEAGKKGTNSAAAKSWLTWGTEVLYPTSGVVTVIKRKATGYSHATGSSSGFHVAFFVSLSQDHVRLLGGNQQDQVKYSNFPLSKFEVKGYRKPL